jgi:hypothetical protein
MMYFCSGPPMQFLSGVDNADQMGVEGRVMELRQW